MFKTRILKLISKFYLQEANALVQKQLFKYKAMLNVLIEEASVRLETDDYRKLIILKEVKQEENTHYDFRITELYTITFGDVYLIEVYVQAILKFAESVKKSESCASFAYLAETVVEQSLQIY